MSTAQTYEQNNEQVDMCLSQIMDRLRIVNENVALGDGILGEGMRMTIEDFKRYDTCVQIIWLVSNLNSTPQESSRSPTRPGRIQRKESLEKGFEDGSSLSKDY